MVRYLELKDIKAYALASDFSDKVWDPIAKWDWFNKRTVGAQFVSAADSIAANIAEGFGRYHKKDKQKFYYNARASVYETSFWLEKSFKRKLINEKEYLIFLEILRLLPKEINSLIKYTEEKLAI